MNSANSETKIYLKVQKKLWLKLIHKNGKNLECEEVKHCQMYVKLDLMNVVKNYQNIMLNIILDLKQCQTQ